MTIPVQTVQAANAAQAAYGSFGNSTDDDPLVLQVGGGDFTASAAQRFLGIGGGSSGPFADGLARVSFLNDAPDGFSATLFRFRGTEKPLLAIRGTNGAIDALQDAQLLIKGVASSQFISLFRYYKRLTTPDGQSVQYTTDDVALLRRLNNPISHLPVIGTLTNVALDLQLATDRGLGVLQPGEALTVTGHSLGGHLALLFGRAFPFVAESIYTFNAPGISAWGNVFLNSAGLLPNDPARVVNVVSDFGMDMAAAYGTRPGPTHRVFIEAGGPKHNHSIAQLSDSLALYDLLAKLSPATGLDEISSILAAASRVPAESLERSLDMLALATTGEESSTPIAVVAADQVQRDAYYAKLYALRDQFDDGGSWRIMSLAGRSGRELFGSASENPGIRYALTELMPFALGELGSGEGGGSPPDSNPDGPPGPPPNSPPPAGEGSGDGEAETSFSRAWLEQRANFLAALLDARADDQLFVASGSSQSSFFFDVDRDEKAALLGTTLLAAVEASEVPLTLSQLASLTYDRTAVFGADSQADVLQGQAGADSLFGGGGDDALRGLSGHDYLEGGEGSDTLEGGAGDDELAGDAGNDLLAGGEGTDIYLLEPEEGVDRIRDSDGRGEVRLGLSTLTGGVKDEAGRYVSTDGQHVYAFSGDLLNRGTLTIDNALQIDDFLNGELNIRLTALSDPPPAIETDYAYQGDFSRHFVELDPYFNVIGTGPATPQLEDIFRHGRPGNTFFDPGSGNDYVADGYSGDDWLFLGSDDDYGFGGEGNDRIEGGSERDILLGGRGNDSLYAESPDVDVEELVPVVPFATYGFVVEVLSGGEGDDAIVGNARAEYLEGGAGADLIVGGGGSDVIAGDGYYLSVHAGEEYDVVVEYSLVGTIVVDRTTHVPDNTGMVEGWYHGPALSPATYGPYLDPADAGDDVIHAGTGNDSVFAGSGNDIVNGGSGADRLEGGRGNDELWGEAGNDTLDGQDGDDSIEGAAGQDSLAGGAGGDFLKGGDGFDSLAGGDDADVLEGGDLGDSLSGGDGNDTLLGGAGTDSLRGGPGADLLDGGSDWSLSWLGDGDTIVFRRGQVFADGEIPATATIRFTDAVVPEDVAVVTSPDGGWILAQRSTLGGLIFYSELSQWTGIAGEFADGTTWDHADFVAHVIGNEELIGTSAPFGTAGPDAFSGAAGSDAFSGGTGNDRYYFVGGGRDSVDDTAGNDTVILAGVRSDETAVVASGEDYLLRYAGGELRLVGQATPEDRVETVLFNGDGATWTQAELEEHAVQLPDAQPSSLGVQVAVAGEPFSFVVAADTFGQQYTFGTTSYAVSNLEGGTLPAWLAFDAEERSFSGTPAESDAGVTGLLVALRDGDEPVAATSLVISVEAPAEEEPSGIPVFPNLLSALAPLLQVTRALVSAVVPPAPQAMAAMGFAAPVFDTQAEAAAVTAAQVTAKVDAPVSSPIESLFSTPPTSQAPDMLAAYAAAIEEFKAEGQAREAQAAGPPPTDEEIARYNGALHAWLDEDRRRFSSPSDDEAWDYGSSGTGFIAGGIGIDRLVGAADEAFARPGLSGLPAIHAQPGLREGLADLGG